MRDLAISVMLALGLAGMTAPAAAAPCKDAKGRFVRCPQATPRPAPRCKNAKGHFAKCGTPGAKPA